MRCTLIGRTPVRLLTFETHTHLFFRARAYWHVRVVDPQGNDEGNRREALGVLPSDFEITSEAVRVPLDDFKVVQRRFERLQAAQKRDLEAVRVPPSGVKVNLEAVRVPPDGKKMDLEAVEVLRIDFKVVGRRFECLRAAQGRIQKRFECLGDSVTIDLEAVRVPSASLKKDLEGVEVLRNDFEVDGKRSECFGSPARPQ